MPAAGATQAILRIYSPEGAQVLIRQFFTVRQGITNRNGYFRTNTVRGRAKYLIQWERYHYSIRRGLTFQAETHGPRVKQQPWNLYINGGISKYHSIIHRAAHHYYYKSIKGLKRPPQNSAWKPQMKIAAIVEPRTRNGVPVHGTHCSECRWFGVLARLKIYDAQRSSLDIYSTTIHELAHASHWELRKNSWFSTSRKVKESWATGVEWALTRMVYPRHLGIGFNRGDYTPVVADMIDGPAVDSTRTNYGYIDSQDQVSGYTIEQIENVLRYTSSWNEWRDNIKNSYNNSTKDHLDRLFRAYE